MHLCLDDVCDSELWRRLVAAAGVTSAGELRQLPQQQRDTRELLDRLLAAGAAQRASLEASGRMRSPRATMPAAVRTASCRL